MELSLKKTTYLLDISTFFLFLFLFTLFFPIRHVFFSHFSYLTGQYSDFTSFLLYLSDISLILALISILLSKPEVFFQSIKPLKWLILWIFVVFFVNFGLNKAFNIYFSIKLLELIVTYGTTATLFQEKNIKIPFFDFFVGLSAIQSLLAIMQFHFQHPVGLFKLGEQQVYPNILGIAKIISNGQTLVRGYGTFFHPNPLSAFLVAGILINIYLLSIVREKKNTAVLAVTLLLNILGLAVTFSRGAYFSLAIALIIYFGYLLFKKIELKKTLLSLILVLVGIIIALFCFKQFLFTRATISDFATTDRITYDKIGLKMITSQPLFGVGAGESLLLMNHYSPVQLLPWDIQPIHNYYLLAAAELGIPGALILIWIFLSHFYVLVLRIKNQESNNKTLTTNYLLLITILSSFLVLMMFDHYFYTLEQTQMLLWVILGLITAEIKNSPAGEHTKT